MVTKMTKTAGRRAGAQHLSDRRYYVQCAYRVTMALISLVALIIVSR